MDNLFFHNSLIYVLYISFTNFFSVYKIQNVRVLESDYSLMSQFFVIENLPKIIEKLCVLTIIIVF